MIATAREYEPRCGASQVLVGKGFRFGSVLAFQASAADSWRLLLGSKPMLRGFGTVWSLN
jgi:hypothetical protein